MPFRMVVPFKNAQLTPKPASTDRLTPVTAHSRPKKYMRRTPTQQKLLALSEYCSTGWIDKSNIANT